ncbi:Putative transcriptional regulatory protein NadR (probably AsnC-family) [Mycobacterium tuberculosis]|nr:Putative transcriptional regulatory protein NadR (probably AsnC-family) [Mycobacterium tuberculosis]COU02268.1 Putative transcriptional regulatory protein NadR (probably AsnC-family) [Mycobacterium tuberculosis]COU74757.1 Putative transcriptional regulatory protein NadR (probably AsnC-family) [Mycobacterium tuberculosis]SGA56379.1 Putative transcriptional regulatory protein NadR (probably AsnC-family) [Mycobacterium tuberculosis]SGQ42366.1 Putative transcriptional regulatory protein NadR (pr
MTHGMVLGKFMPPHAGHVYLCEFARRWVDELTIVVGSTAAEPIPGAQRVAWMRELFPFDRVVHLANENPQRPWEHPDFWDIWKASLQGVLATRSSSVPSPTTRTLPRSSERVSWRSITVAPSFP